MGLFDFLKTNPATNESGQTGNSQWDWKKTIKDLTPILMAAGGASLYGGFQQGQTQMEEQKRQANQDAWNKMIRDEEMKRLKMQNEALANSQIELTPDMAEQTKGTKYQDFLWEPDKTNTTVQTGDQNPLMTMDLEEIMAANKDPFKLTPGLNGTAPLMSLDTKTETVPGAFKPQKMAKKEWLGMTGDIQDQKTNQAALKQKIAMATEFIDSIPDTDPRKPMLAKALNYGVSTGDTSMIEKYMTAAMPTGEKSITPYESEKLKIDWFNATKEKTTEAKDPLLLSIKELATYSSSNAPTGTKQNLIKQYSQAIRENISDPVKAKQYIDRYNYLTGNQYTYDQWKGQSKIGYNSKGMPIKNAAIANNKTAIPPITVNADAQKVIKQYGSIDAAIAAGKKQGLPDSNLIMKALLDAKNKQKSKGFLGMFGT